MRLDEYLTTVAEQIRYTKIRPTVTEELEHHILDQAEAYETAGAFPEEALDRAIREMGDPVETGVSLDRIHRPHMNWNVILIVGILSIFSIGMMSYINRNISDIFSCQEHTRFTLIGFILMLVICRLDYSLLGKLGWKAAAGYLIAVTGLYILSPHRVYGVTRWIQILWFDISVSELLFLYVPLFGAALYSFRGDHYIVLLKILPLIFTPCLLLLRAPDLSGSALLFVCLFLLFLFTVWKGWYQINRKLVTGIGTALTLLSPCIFVGFFYFFGESYQQARIDAFFSNTGDANYMFTIARMIRESSGLLGCSKDAFQLFSLGNTAEYMTDFILVSMCTVYGTIITIVLLAILLLLIMKIFRLSIRQKNQLGMVIGVGCGLVFLVKSLLSILINLQLLPYVSISMPFLSYGGSNVIASYILLGLVLSIYRYKNILPNKKIKQTQTT